MAQTIALQPETLLVAPVPVNEIPAEDDLVTVYKRSNAKRRADLLDIMSAALIDELRNSYLKELDAAIAHLEAQHHPAAIPARAMADEIRADKLSDATTFDILHKTIDLATTPADSPHFQQKTDDFRTTMNALKKNANSSRLLGAVLAFGVAICIAAVITLNVLTLGPVGIVNAKNIISSLLVLTPFVTVSTIWSSVMFSMWKKEKTMLDKMGAFDKAMHEAPAPKL